jgi:hypothetical protein
MIRKLLRVMLALVLAGAVPMLLFIAKYGTGHYFNYLVVLTPVILALSLAIGGLFYVALRALHIRLSLPICIVTGAVVGSLPGILLSSLLILVRHRRRLKISGHILVHLECLVLSVD